MAINLKLIFGLVILVLFYMVIFSGQQDESLTNFSTLEPALKLREFIRYNFYSGMWDFGEHPESALQMFKGKISFALNFNYPSNFTQESSLDYKAMQDLRLNWSYVLLVYDGYYLDKHVYRIADFNGQMLEGPSST